MRISRFLAPACGVVLAVTAVAAQAAGPSEQTTKSAKSKKAPSVCVGLSESACGGNAACYWRKAAVLKSGKTRRAHCRLKTHAAKRKASST